MEWKVNEDGYLITDTHVFFYKGWLSNFYKCNFSYTYNAETHIFNSTEKAFMWTKAMYFRDFEIAEKILKEFSPAICKKYGREVRNYNDEEWNKIRFSIMYMVNEAKYNQNDYLKKKLLQPDFWNKTFVEASPIDKIWGVGMDITNPDIVFPKNWKGNNLLGQVITQIQKNIMNSGMCRVKDLIEHLSKYDPEAFICYGEMNAFNGGFWQHIDTDSLKMFIHSVQEEKEQNIQRYGKNSEELKNMDKDYIYVEDKDVIVRF